MEFIPKLSFFVFSLFNCILDTLVFVIYDSFFVDSCYIFFSSFEKVWSGTLRKITK